MYRLDLNLVSQALGSLAQLEVLGPVVLACMPHLKDAALTESHSGYLAKTQAWNDQGFKLFQRSGKTSFTCNNWTSQTLINDPI